MPPRLPFEISDSLRLPLNAVTEAFGVIGVRGSGKTTTARVLVEEMLSFGCRSVVIDPLGAWWGLRSSASGTDFGFDVLVLGGEHGDVPLTPGSGSLIADLVIEHQQSFVLDLSDMRKADQRRFMLAFCDTLYHRNREPLHLVVDECDLYVPQRIPSGQEPLVGAMEDIVRRGRIKGLGITLISQRPASVNKDVLSQVSVLVAHRLVGSHDRKALDVWVEAQADPEQSKIMMGSIAKLGVGEAWVWSPHFLNVFDRVKVRKPRTYDSSATPQAGARARTPSAIAKVDVEALKARMSEVVIEAEANDPKALKRRIVDLERQVRELQDNPMIERIEVEKQVLPPRYFECLDQLRELEASMRLMAGDMVLYMPGSPEERAVKTVKADGYTKGGVSDEVTEIHRHDLILTSPEHPDAIKTKGNRAFRFEPAMPMPPGPVYMGLDGDPDKSLNKAERSVLTTLAQFRDEGRTRAQLSFFTGYSIKSSSLANALGALRSKGYVNKGGEPILITHDGLVALGQYEALPRGQALADMWMGKLNKAERAVLEAMLNVYPATLDKDALAVTTGYSATSSSLANALGKLRSLGLVDGWHVDRDFAESIA